MYLNNNYKNIFVEIDNMQYGYFRVGSVRNSLCWLGEVFLGCLNSSLAETLNSSKQGLHTNAVNTWHCWQLFVVL